MSSNVCFKSIYDIKDKCKVIVNIYKDVKK